MKSSGPDFGSRLFRLLLLFSLIPAAILTALGYYLVRDAGSNALDDSPRSATTVAEYYNDYLFQDIRTALQDYERTGVVSSRLEFMVEVGDGRLQSPPEVTLLAPDIAEQLVRASRDKPEGLLVIGDEVFQYVLITSNSRTLIGGITHGPAFVELSRSLQLDLSSRSTGRELQAQYVLFLGGLFLILALFIIVAAFLLSRRAAGNLASPLQDLSDAATAISEGDFTIRVAPRGETDIRRLIDSFNDMAEQLDHTTARLAATERVAAWRQVARRFAHELKNPLQPILISLYRIEKQLIETEQYDLIYEPLKAASEEVRHLTRLAERFSHLAKLPPPSPELTDIGDIVSSVVTLYREGEVAYTIALDIPEAPCMASVDTAYLREALHNLVQNALDATDKAGNINVAVTCDDNYVRIEVEDDGSGMDQATLDSARLPYFTTKPTGHGLGLAIVEKSVHELGGQLEINSVPHRGTTAVISLPVEN